MSIPVKLIECPRDAMQGIKPFIPTAQKVQYLNQLLQVGFDTLDFGSFVSPKAIPQMRDTAEVLSQLDLTHTATKLLAIVANERGARDAVQHAAIQYLGYPFSISETFQMRNTNATIAESIDRVKAIQDLCVGAGKSLVVYLSMGFGNPYGDPWNAEIVEHWTAELYKMDIQILSLSDTVGVANPETITYLFEHLGHTYPQVEFGAHLHTTPDTWHEKVDAAYKAGCRRYDGALRGFGGCPMAKDKLTGNMPMENMVAYFGQQGEALGLDADALQVGMKMALDVFPSTVAH